VVEDGGGSREMDEGRTRLRGGGRMKGEGREKGRRGCTGEPWRCRSSPVRWTTVRHVLRVWVLSAAVGLGMLGQGRRDKVGFY
jgi:hypothetical protein